MLQSNHNMHGTFLFNHVRPSMKRVAYEVALKEKKQLAEGTIAFVFEKPNGFHFQAGQHIRMTLLNPPETDSEGNRRFFSLANAPQEKDLVIALRMRDTAFKRVLGRIHIGDKVRIEILLKSPHRSFTLHDDPSKPAVFLIGGIGIVPAFSMIKDATERNLPHEMFLFYSNRRPEDAPFLDELEHLAQHNPSFKLIATMTDPEQSAKTGRGETGYIDHSMLERYVDDLQSPIYYLAGLPEMVSAMKTMLTDSGVREENIRAEEFTGFNLNEIHDGNNHAWKRPVLLVAIVLVIIVVVILHVSAAISIVKSGLGESFLTNPIFYFMIGLMLVVAPFKFKHFLGFMHRKKKQSTQEITKG
jgi:ferredoxin-NADP reductase